MTGWSEAFHALLPNWRKSNAVPQSERDSRRMGETDAERLVRISKSER